MLPNRDPVRHLHIVAERFNPPINNMLLILAASGAHPKTSFTATSASKLAAVRDDSFTKGLKSQILSLASLVTYFAADS